MIRAGITDTDGRYPLTNQKALIFFDPRMLLVRNEAGDMNIFALSVRYAYTIRSTMILNTPLLRSMPPFLGRLHDDVLRKRRMTGRQNFESALKRRGARDGTYTSFETGSEYCLLRA